MGHWSIHSTLRTNYSASTIQTPNATAHHRIIIFKMAPSVEALEQYLRDGVRAIVSEGGWEQVTVNNVRQHVANKAGLEPGFFKTDDWEARSKKVIKGCVAQLLAEEDENPTSPAAPKTEPKNGVKRQSSEESSPVPKRQKKASRPLASKKTKSKKEESESELSDLGDLSEDEKPSKATAKKVAKKDDSDSDLSELSLSEDEPKPKPKKSAPRRKAKKEDTESELSDLGDSEEEPPKKAKTKAKAKAKAKAPKKSAPRRKSKNGVKKDEEASDLEDSPADKKRKRATSTKKRNVKQAKVESGSEDDLVDEKEEQTKDEIKSDVDVDADTKAEPSPQVNATRDLKAEESDEETKPKNPVDEDTKAAKVDDSDSSLSSVLDEPPPKKRKSKEPKGASKPKQTKEVSGDDAEIKKLQGHLVKCGIRKIWGIELKKYGDDSKGKIRHLRGMLREAGIDGRFSEAKAKEIKERRELMADLEAVTEMDRNWGVAGRASRSKAAKKSMKEETDDEDAGNEVKNDDDDDGAKANTRVSKRMADLAFLGDDSESD
ncbi:hypothetical protein GGR53DRAFT_514528 [Hypoxylon sp. FL1150]|nr:hypothetical protein GGR53DRAFT_514528 [Hypoxylon sp. FL1150]